MKIFDAVYLVGGIDCEGYSVQTFTANYAFETHGVVGFPSGTENPIEDWFRTDAALF